MQQSDLQVVYTNKAHCRDCYRCLRVCPVKAIRMQNGQAYVVAERCISCGTCIRECPQGAKAFRNDVDKAARLLETGVPVAASIAPSFVAVFSDWEQKCLPSALRKLGFSYIGETAIGAYHVAKETTRFVTSHKKQSHICTSCPAVVSYVEHYESAMVDNLVPVVSPMIAHARHIKEKLGKDAKVVFIGPCVAKKSEAQKPEHEGVVDCVLTFAELEEWFENEGISLAQCEASGFNEEPEGDARYFPIVGGSIRTGKLDTDVLAPSTISVSGFNEVKEALIGMSTARKSSVIEPLFCSQGCVNGPAIATPGNMYERRRNVLEYAAENPGKPENKDAAALQLSVSFHAETVLPMAGVTEQQILDVLEKTGKAATENQLNCGACGYSSCREKAIAVVQGMAELEMCIPYMKRLAEQRTDRIIETSPNGIVILDDRLHIISMNPAFRKFFMCSEAVCGKPISYLMDPDQFERLASGETNLVEFAASHSRYNLVCHEILYALPEERQFIGIFVNITKTQADEKKLDELRAKTVMQARELLEHQTRMAQTIARFLGESTAQSEGLLEKLMLIAGDEAGDQDGDGKLGMEWIKDIYTSK